ncbi:MAG: DUF1302 domain-containing protein [Brachymonas sp.]
MSSLPSARFTLSLIAVAASFVVSTASAHTVPLGSDGEIRYNFTANYGLAQRLEAPNAAVTDVTVNPSNANTNDGDLNFKKNAIINNRLSVLGEADIRYKANQGVFLRAQAFYDAAYHGKTDNTTPPLSFTDNHAPGAAEFSRGTRRASGGEAEFLDAYWYGDFKVGENSALNIKVGRHVVQWGEGVFFANIAGAQAPVDVNKVNVPGAQVKDFLLPVGQVSVNYSLNNKWTLMGYAQYEFRETKLPAAGNFWSVVDFLGPGSESMFLGMPTASPRGNDIKPSASGQWGLGARYITDNSTEIGVYHLRYHSRAPSLQVNLAGVPFPPFAVPASYQIRYQDDIKLTGASFNTRAGDVAVAGEISYKQNVPVWVLTALGPTNYLPQAGALNFNPADGIARGNVMQAQISSTYIVAPNPIAPGGITLVGELAYQRALSKKTPLPWSSTRDSSAIALLAIPSYPDVFDGWDLKVPLTYMQVLGGKSAAACATSCHATFPSGDSLTLLGDKEKRFSIGAQLTYLGNLQLGMTYTKFLGKPDYVHNPAGDRDNIALNVTYNF